jgi:hypothetical protein
MNTPLNYWLDRRCFKYYQEALRFCRKYSVAGSSVLEVGPRDTTFLDWLDWIPRKVAIDRDLQPVIKGATNIQGDFLQWRTEEKFDLAVCLQVLEHLEDPVPFAEKLLASASMLIVSVPYRWRAGSCKWHRQDPVDLPKLIGWFRQDPIEYVITRDEGAERLVAAFDQITH